MKYYNSISNSSGDFKNGIAIAKIPGLGLIHPTFTLIPCPSWG